MRSALPVVAIAAVVLAVAVPAFFGWRSEHAGTLAFWLLVTVPTGVVAALGAFRAHRDGELREWLRPRWGDATVGVLVACALMAGAYVFTRAVAPPDSPRVAWLLRIYLQLGDPAVLRQNVGIVAGVVIFASLAEEIVWRGLVTTLLAERIGSRYAWIVSAFLYAAAHVPAAFAVGDPTAGPNLVLLLGALGAGLVWGALVRLKGGSLVAAVISHALFDWCVAMMFRLAGPSI